MLYQTTQEHEAFRQKMRGFAESEVKPIAFMLDQNNEFPAEAVKKLGEMGLMGIPYPKEYGGPGLMSSAMPSQWRSYPEWTAVPALFFPPMYR